MMPIGSIIAWNSNTIPDGWAVCDGNNGTPDLVDKFVYGAANDGQVRNTGGNSSHSHTNPKTNERATHNHTVLSASDPSGGGSISVTSGEGTTGASSSHNHSGSMSVTAAGNHNHTVGNTNSVSHIPPHIKRIFIKRIA